MCLPIARRRFAVAQDAQAPQVVLDSFSTEVFANLDDGQTAGPRMVLRSLGRHAPEYKTMPTNSKSGEFFFFSGDRRFLIKTVSQEEGELLHRMLPAYKHHIKTTPRSRIVRYAGVFKMELAGGTITRYFTVMASVFAPGFTVHSTFDIKGSMLKRRRKEGESIGKDEDWVESGARLHLSETLRRELLAVHEQDLEFLESFGVMDYSVLIGIHNLPPSVEKGSGWWDKGMGIWADDAREVYFVGLIDFLIQFGLYKKSEQLVYYAKGVHEKASCTDPTSYARRQVAFLQSTVLPNESVLCGTAGRLDVLVKAAYDLRKADLFGKSDPYVIVQVGLQTARTKTIPKTLFPEWNEQLSFAVNLCHMELNLEVTVMDEDAQRFARGSDDFLGRFTLPMPRVCQQRHLEVREKLQDTFCGELEINISFEPSDLPRSLQMVGNKRLQRALSGLVDFSGSK